MKHALKLAEICHRDGKLRVRKSWLANLHVARPSAPLAREGMSFVS